MTGCTQVADFFVWETRAKLTVQSLESKSLLASAVGISKPRRTTKEQPGPGRNTYMQCFIILGEKHMIILDEKSQHHCVQWPQLKKLVKIPS